MAKAKKKPVAKKKPPSKKKAVSKKLKVKKNDPKFEERKVVQADLDANPSLVDKGVEVGDILSFPKKEGGRYKLTISMNGEEYEALTDEIGSAVMGFNPDVFKTKVIVKVEYEGRTADFVLQIPKAKLIFRNQLAAMYFEKRVKLSINGN